MKPLLGFTFDFFFLVTINPKPMNKQNTNLLQPHKNVYWFISELHRNISK